MQRLKEKKYPDGSSESYTYDARDNVLTAATKDVSYVFTYDGANRVKTVSDSRGYAVSYDYDAAGNRTKMVLQPGTAEERVTQYSYDDVGRLASMLTPAGTFAFGYDMANRRTSLAYPNQVTAAYGYDGAGRLDSITYKTQGGAVVSSVTYTHDAVGNRLSKGGVCTETYAYDSIDQLLSSFSSAGAEQFSYDEVGNRLWGPGRKDTGYEHDAANRMTKGRQYVYSYDENGNQISKAISGHPNKGWTYTWDYENRLVRAERMGEGGGRTVTFKYDPFGRRIEKHVVATVDGVTKTTIWQYVYDGTDVVIEAVDVGGSTAITRYDHGLGTDEHLAMEKEGRFYFYHADGLGSVVSITDASGSVVQSYSYDSFGMLKPSTSFENSYTYTGREWDKQTGLYYYRARYYDSIEGRFFSKDPIGFEGGDVIYNRDFDNVGEPAVPQVNLYQYSENNSINLTDPLGLFSVRAGVIYDDYGTPVGEAGLENPSFLADPINWFPTGVAVKGGKTCIIEGVKRGGWMNSNPWLRVGFGKHEGRKVFRMSGGLIKRFKKSGHVDFWKGPRL